MLADAGGYWPMLADAGCDRLKLAASLRKAFL